MLRVVGTVYCFDSYSDVSCWLHASAYGADKQKHRYYCRYVLIIFVDYCCHSAPKSLDCLLFVFNLDSVGNGVRTLNHTCFTCQNHKCSAYTLDDGNQEAEAPNTNRQGTLRPPALSAIETFHATPFWSVNLYVHPKSLSGNTKISKHYFVSCFGLVKLE